MAAPKKYPDELRERVTRLAVELRADPVTTQGAIARVAERLGMHPEALRNWVRQAEIDGGVRPGTMSAEAQRIAQLEQEVRELRRAKPADARDQDEAHGERGDPSTRLHPEPTSRPLRARS